MGNIAVLGMGSNLGNSPEQLNTAATQLARLPTTKLLQASHLYLTKPQGYAEQPDFYNACLMLETGLSPYVLLGACLGLEAAAGRERTLANGPRPLDLDLLLYETVHNDSFELTLPHPRILERAFVMVPLLELYPSGRAPGLFFEPHLRKLDTSGVTRLDMELEWGE